MTNAKPNPHAADEPTLVQRGAVRLACYDSGARDDLRPTLVFVHGYPDTHRVWDRMVAPLSETFRCVRYDVRGAGQSSRPRATAAYALDELEADLAAVIDWASPSRPVHLIAHDWGSIQSWEAVTDPALSHRIASFTSISGPCLDHVGHWLRAQWRDDRAALMRQLKKSWYVFAFHIPWLPTLAWHGGLASRWPRTTERLEGQALPVHPTLARDGAHGTKLYRANVFARIRRPRLRHAQIPVHVITPVRDAFVGPGFARDLDRWVDDLTITPVDAAHWAVLTHPQSIADLCADFIRARPAPDVAAPEARPNTVSPRPSA
ncbi:alpha/beta fold hydrolase [Salinisphaera sp. T31B1]|uniref:alpha/beta fold hydrolase n=1 Tax=Salinisphaera sp. T31B1 TaxID=727963 RepID=UPI00333EE915